MSVTDFISANSADFARVRTPDTEPQQREKLTSALTEAGGHVLPELDGALRVTGLALPRISDLAHEADVRLWELSPHQASLEEAYMRMTQGAVDYRSTVDQRSGLQQPLPPGVAAADAGAGPGPAGLVRPAAARSRAPRTRRRRPPLPGTGGPNPYAAPAEPTQPEDSR